MKAPRLRLSTSRKIRGMDARLREPSGLSCDRRTGNLWTVSDDGAQLFELDQNGDLLSVLDHEGGAGDYEGVTCLSDGRVALVCESRSEILIADLANGSIVARNSLSRMVGNDRLPNRLVADTANRNGLEGLTFDPIGGKFLAVVERSPRLLIEISANLETVLSVQELTREIGIADKDDDVSGLEWDACRKILWIVSDTGGRVYLYDTTTGNATSRKLKRKGKSVKGAEGVALSPDGQMLFVVTDAGAKSRFLGYEIRPSAS